MTAYITPYVITFSVWDFYHPGWYTVTLWGCGIHRTAGDDKVGGRLGFQIIHHPRGYNKGGVIAAVVTIECCCHIPGGWSTALL